MHEKSSKSKFYKKWIFCILILIFGISIYYAINTIKKKIYNPRQYDLIDEITKQSEMVYKKYNVRVSPGYFLNTIKFDITEVYLKDLVCCSFNKENECGDEVALLSKENPHLQYVLGNKQALYATRCKNNKHHFACGDYDKLIHKLEKEGYQPEKGIIVINKENMIRDGLHRASWLAHKYGGNFKIKVFKTFRMDDM